jgi:hypothetical protein
MEALQSKVTLPYETAAQIAVLLKEDMRAIDREIRKNKSAAGGEMSLNLMRDRRKTVRGAYDALKRAGVATEDTTIVNDW